MRATLRAAAVGSSCFRTRKLSHPASVGRALVCRSRSTFSSVSAPLVGVGPWASSVLWAVMPEAALDQDRHFGTTEDEVGRPPYWLQWSRHYSVAKAQGVKTSSMRHRRTGVSRSVGLHVSSSRRCSRPRSGSRLRSQRTGFATMQRFLNGQRVLGRRRGGLFASAGPLEASIPNHLGLEGRPPLQPEMIAGPCVV